MMRRVQQQRSLAEAHEHGVLDNVQLEVAKMNMLALKASAEGKVQSLAVDSTAAMSRLREIAAQLLQFPVPRGCFAPCLIMKDTCVIMVELAEAMMRQ